LGTAVAGDLDLLSPPATGCVLALFVSRLCNAEYWESEPESVVGWALPWSSASGWESWPYL